MSLEAYYTQESIKTILIFLVIFAVFGIVCFVHNKKKEWELRQRLQRQWGQRPVREYEYAEYDAIGHYFERKEKTGYFVDDITWNDLDMDTIFMLLNHTNSTIGESYLYSMLREPVLAEGELDRREELVQYFLKNPKEREQMEYFFACVGKTGTRSVFDYIYNLTDFRPEPIGIHVICIGSILAPIFVMFSSFQAGILLLLLAFAFSWSVYFTKKKKIEPYIVSCKCFLEMLKTANKMQCFKSPVLEPYVKAITDAGAKFKKFKRNSYFVVKDGGSMESVILDYVNQTFHINLIQFPTLVRVLSKNIRDFEVLTKNMGEMEAAIAIASFRTMMDDYCIPELSSSRKVFLNTEQVYHPMIDEPVKNAISEKRGVLLTGSNASGKSTFLKTVAINAILAQTIHTCMADRYEACFFQIYSSMALRDDLDSQESYYIVEIKSLKRILDHISEETPMLCFVDEVLRGTNTVERIAASSQILKSMAKENIMCFAATHDIELTHILEAAYSNYHFQEEVQDNDILFNYRLYKGRATSRNAIKLLGIIGYDRSIIDHAEQEAQHFLETGEWEP